MIDLTRLNGHRLIVNCDLIKLVEATPDTTLTLLNGEKILILNSCDDLTERISAYRADILRRAWPTASQALVADSVPPNGTSTQAHGVSTQAHGASTPAQE